MIQFDWLEDQCLLDYKTKEQPIDNKLFESRLLQFGHKEFSTQFDQLRYKQWNKLHNLRLLDVKRFLLDKRYNLLFHTKVRMCLVDISNNDQLDPLKFSSKRKIWISFLFGFGNGNFYRKPGANNPGAHGVHEISSDGVRP
jgi:hypothetical protein